MTINYRARQLDCSVYLRAVLRVDHEDLTRLRVRQRRYHLTRVPLAGVSGGSRRI